MDVQDGVVLFADIVGSTKIFEQLGDQLAAQRINHCISELSKITQQNNGIIIKTIGDEIMCSFSDADRALTAAGQMQTCAGQLPIAGEERMALRIGAHFGQFISTQNDIAGDAVNVAARLASAAGAKRILLSEETVEKLSPIEKSKTRAYDRVTLKGKQEETFIYEYLWEMSDVTTISIPVSFDKLPVHTLTLQYDGKKLTLTSDSQTFWLGRHHKNDLVIDSNMSSRLHAKIEYQRGKFLVTDDSTNGTFILSSNEEVYIRRESLPLVGTGTICLGESTKSPNCIPIQYHVEHS